MFIVGESGRPGSRRGGREGIDPEEITRLPQTAMKKDEDYGKRRKRLTTGAEAPVVDDRSILMTGSRGSGRPQDVRFLETTVHFDRDVIPGRHHACQKFQRLRALQGDRRHHPGEP